MVQVREQPPLRFQIQPLQRTDRDGAVKDMPPKVQQPIAQVAVEQFGMAQCPWTSTLTSTFYDECIERGVGIAPLINYTLNMVGGKGGGIDYLPGTMGKTSARVVRTY